MSRHLLTANTGGTVLDNVDPEQRGRLMLNVPDVLGPIPSSWAEPVVRWRAQAARPWACILSPHPARVYGWSFEHGDPDYPIWSGCRWGSQSDVPSNATAGNPADPNIVIQSLLQHSIMISDMPPSADDGGHHHSEHDRCADRRQRFRASNISNGKGASITRWDLWLTFQRRAPYR